jgi:hypothetical protein
MNLMQYNHMICVLIKKRCVTLRYMGIYAPTGLLVNARVIV